MINPNASCLSSFINKIPIGGFAGVQTVSFEYRKLFHGWNRYYYDDLRENGYDISQRYPELHVNAGLLLYRNEEVWERWIELLSLDLDINEENRLNAYGVQDGRCFFLPRHWNTV